MKGKSSKAGPLFNIYFILLPTGKVNPMNICEEKVQVITDFIFLDSNIHRDGDCNHEMVKRCLLLGRNTVTNLDRILTCRNITLATKLSIIKPMQLSIVFCDCETRIFRNAEWKIAALNGNVQYNYWLYNGVQEKIFQ